MPRVNARSFMMTDLCKDKYGATLLGHGGWVMNEGSHVGTAGAMLDFSCAAGLEPMVSSFSRRVFS